MSRLPDWLYTGARVLDSVKDHEGVIQFIGEWENPKPAASSPRPSSCALKGAASNGSSPTTRCSATPTPAEHPDFPPRASYRATDRGGHTTSCRMTGRTTPRGTGRSTR